MTAERSALPAAPFHVARLVAVMAEDCGDCVMIEIHLAKEAGVPIEILRKVIEIRLSDLPEELGDV